MPSKHFTDVSVVHDPVDHGNPWHAEYRVDYKRDGVEKSHAFNTAARAADFAARLEAGELDDDVFAVKAPVVATSTKHTPGPWGWTTNGRGEIRLSTPDRGHLYVMGFARKGMQGATPRFSQWEGQRGCMNSGWMRDAADFIVDGVLSHPDALLIAAAPDLLEALQAVVSVADRATVEFDKARAAIAKATGVL